MAITKIRIPKAPKAPKPSGSTSYVLGAQMDKPSKVKGKKPTKGLTLAQITGTAPRTPAESTTTGETIAAAPPVTPVAAPVTTTTTTPGVPPSASWWTNQYTAS